KKFRLELTGLAKLFGALVQFGVERDHAAVGVTQLLIELLAFLVLAAKLIQALHQLAILLAQDLERIGRVVFLERSGHVGEPCPRHWRSTRRQIMAELDRRALADPGLDLEMIHQAARAENTEPHSAFGAILSVENGLDIGNAGAFVRNPDVKDLRRRRR